MNIIELIEDDMGCANDCPMKNDGHYDIEKCNCYKRQVIERIKELETALGESVKLQTHYAKLLNMHDGGKRLGFESHAAWVERLKTLGVIKTLKHAGGKIQDQNKSEWCYSFDEERYHGRFDSREAAIEDARKADNLMERLFVARCVEPDISVCIPDGDDLMDDIEERFSDNYGSEDDVFDVGKEQTDLLASTIKGLVMQWPVNWFTVEDVEEVTFDEGEGKS